MFACRAHSVFLLPRRSSALLRHVVLIGDSSESAVTLSVPSSSSSSSAKPQWTGKRYFAARISRRQADVENNAVAGEEDLVVRDALRTVLGDGGDNLENRIAAVKKLGRLASAPVSSQEAEEALYKVLKEATGDSSANLRKAAEQALVNSWRLSGDVAVDVALARGVKLFEWKEFQQAANVFTEVIRIAPHFSEGWHKRASAYFMLGDFEKSVADCLKVLELKPMHFACLTGLGMCYHRRGDKVEAVKWFKEALKAHPHMESSRLAVDTLELNWQDVMKTRVGPRVMTLVKSLQDGTPVPVSDAPQGLSCSWDVHRVASKNENWTYFYRARVKNSALKGQPLRSIARYYILRLAGGKVYPLTDLTEGKSRFVLEPGEEHCFAWHVVVGEQIIDTVGGVFLERSSEVGADGDERFLNGDLEFLDTFDSASESDVERLKLGHTYVGRIDLKKIVGG